MTPALSASKLSAAPNAIKFEELEMSTQIGEGAFGSVYTVGLTNHAELHSHFPCTAVVAPAHTLQGTYRRGGRGVERVAIKVLKDKPQGGVDQMIREVDAWRRAHRSQWQANIMVQLEHPNLVRLLGVCFNKVGIHCMCDVM